MLIKFRSRHLSPWLWVEDNLYTTNSLPWANFFSFNNTTHTVRCLPYEIKSPKMIRSHKIRHGYHFDLCQPSIVAVDRTSSTHHQYRHTSKRTRDNSISDFSIGHRYFTVTVTRFTRSIISSVSVGNRP